MANDIEKTEDGAPIIIADGLLTDEVIKRAELQVNGLNKIKEISLKITNKNDWVIMNGKPCLNNTGCMKVANLWGVSFHSPVISEDKRTDDRGDYILFTAAGEGEFRGRVVNDIGTFSTRDKLFGSVGGNLKPLADVDLPSIKKGAITNWQSRILKKILGLSFEMSDLEKRNISPANNVNHASGGAGGGLISSAQANRLYAISKTAKKTDEQLKDIIAEYGYSSSKEIKKEDYEEICKKAEEKEIPFGE